MKATIVLYQKYKASEAVQGFQIKRAIEGGMIRSFFSDVEDPAIRIKINDTVLDDEAKSYEQFLEMFLLQAVWGE